MASVNRVTIVGNLGRDPEIRTMPSGDQIANVSIATTDRWRDKNSGEEKSSTEWHRVSFYGRLAEIVSQYLRQGSQVYVEGSLRTRKYQKDGVDHYATEIRADQMQMLGSRQDGGGGGRDQGGYGDGGQQQGRQQQQQPRQQNVDGQRHGGYDNQRQAPQQGRPQQGPQRGYQQQPQQRGGGFDDGSGFGDIEDDIPFIDCSMKHDMESRLDRRIRKSRV